MSPDVNRQLAQLRADLDALSRRTPGIFPGVKVRPDSVGTSQLQAGALAATAAGRALMAAGYFDAATVLDKFGASAIPKSRLGALGIVNGDVDAAAAIAYGKLNLAGAIVAGDLAAQSVTAAKMAIFRRHYQGRVVAFGAAEGGTVAAGATRYTSGNGPMGQDATEANAQWTCQQAGTLVGFSATAKSGAGGTLVATPRVNGADVAAAVLTWNNETAKSTKAVTGLNQAVAVGDVVSVSWVATVSTATIYGSTEAIDHT